MPYIVNLSLSQHQDCILYVNEINQYANLDNKMQYDFYYYSLRAKKRQFQQWFKSSESEDLLNVKEYFGFSSEKAKEALRILTAENLEYIAKIVDKGGRE